MHSQDALIPTEIRPAPGSLGAAGGAALEGGGRRIIEGRFGALAISPQTTLDFPSGLLGFGEFHSYGLADLGDPRFPQFKVLQSLDDDQLAFLVLPLDPSTGFLDRADLDAACNTLSIAVDDLVVLLVITTRKTSEGPSVSANLRAPLLIDAVSRVGIQYVLRNERYPVRFQI